MDSSAEAHIKRRVEKAKRYKAIMVIVVNDTKVEEALMELGKGEIEYINLGKAQIATPM